MPSSELTSIRGAIRSTLLGIWGEWGTWRALGDGGRKEPRRVLVKVQWKSKYLLEQYAGTDVEGVEVYLSRDESIDADEPGVHTPTIGSELELDSELGRPLTFKGDLRDKSTERIKIVMERSRRISTGGRG